MARIKKNDMVKGMSGALGDMIGYKQVEGGNTEAFHLPGKRPGPGTPNQELHKKRFFKATLYAKAVIADPIRKAIYAAKKTKRKTAYVLAVTDYLKAPVISEVTLDAYHGQPGDSIKVVAFDDFKVETVKVTIRNAAGVLLEQGGAVTLPDSTEWIYTSMALNPQIAGSKVIISASDLAGNVTTKETVL